MEQRDDRKNVIAFFSDAGWGEMWHDRVHAHFGMDRVKYSFWVPTVEEFLEVTTNSSGTWDVLVIDPIVASNHAEQIRDFMQQNPGVVVGIEGGSASDLPARPALAGHAFVRPSDIDAWLLVMHRLLDR